MLWCEVIDILIRQFYVSWPMTWYGVHAVWIITLKPPFGIEISVVIMVESCVLLWHLTRGNWSHSVCGIRALCIFQIMSKGVLPFAGHKTYLFEIPGNPRKHKSNMDECLLLLLSPWPVGSAIHIACSINIWRRKETASEEQGIKNGKVTAPCIHIYTRQ